MDGSARPASGVQQSDRLYLASIRRCYNLVIRFGARGMIDLPDIDTSSPLAIKTLAYDMKHLLNSPITCTEMPQAVWVLFDVFQDLIVEYKTYLDRADASALSIASILTLVEAVVSSCVDWELNRYDVDELEEYKPKRDNSPGPRELLASLVTALPALVRRALECPDMPYFHVTLLKILEEYVSYDTHLKKTLFRDFLLSDGLLLAMRDFLKGNTQCSASQLVLRIVALALDYIGGEVNDQDTQYLEPGKGIFEDESYSALFRELLDAYKRSLERINPAYASGSGSANFDIFGMELWANDDICIE